MARLIPVIEVEKVIGKGTDESPLRTIREYWTIDGELLAKSEDPLEI